MPFKTLYCNEGVFVKMKYAKKKVFSTVRVIIETNNIKEEIKLIYTLYRNLKKLELALYSNDYYTLIEI